jgi:hypothetical protein
MTFGLLGYMIFAYGHTDRDRATLESIIVSKELSYLSNLDMESNKLTYTYFYVTFANRKPCEQVDIRFKAIKVRGMVHKCPSDRVEVSAIEWQKLNVGDVLKVVELK